MVSIKTAVLLAPYTTFRIGGPAEYFVRVTTVGELSEALDYAQANHVSIFVLAGGSNILIADRGVRGLVIHMDNQSLRVVGASILADAGIALQSVVEAASQAGLAGMERLAGIPGSLGGAIRGNAGAFGMEIGKVVKSVKAYDRTQSTLRVLSSADCRFTYRNSLFKEHPELIILSAELVLQPGDSAELIETNRETMATREAKHPQQARCAGSFFMNPFVDNPKLHAEFQKDVGAPSKDGKLPAGWLIDQVGLRGKKIGGAQVSPIHPNYFINTGTATADNVLMLASLVKQRVRTELGVELREEVQFVGL